MTELKSPQDPPLVLNNLTFAVPGRGKITANGTLHAAERLIVQGRSGCGKTTFLRALVGLHPSAGSILVAGCEVAQLQPHERNLGFVFQEGALFPFLSVVDNVAFGLRYSIDGRDLSDDLRRERAIAALKRFDMFDLAERSVSRLSGGEAQRVSLLRTLILQPKLFLLDEPLSKLDVENRRELATWIKQILRETQIASVIVSHQDDELTEGDGARRIGFELKRNETAEWLIQF